MGFLISQELQVEGDLNVTGTIESITIDSLKNEINILNGNIDSLFTLYNSVKPIRLLGHQIDLIIPEDEGMEVVVFDTTFSPNIIQEFIRVELNTWTNYNTGLYNTGLYLNAYYGLSGSEESQGILRVFGPGTGGQEGYNYIPQLSWNIIVEPEFIDQPLRLYITMSNEVDHRGGISKLFIWGR